MSAPETLQPPDDVGPAGELPARAGTLRRAAASLTTINVVSFGLGFVTGPLVARALGPEGRGIFAAIAVPVTLTPWIIQLGIGYFVVKAAAEGESPRRLIGSLGVPLVLAGCAGAAAGPWVADFFADGSEQVRRYLLIGFALLPLAMVWSLLADITWGRQRWSQLVFVRLFTPVTYAAAVVVLFASGALTVDSAAIAMLATGTAGLVPLIWIYRHTGRPRFDAGLARAGVLFGLKSWPGTLASLANGRLDQLVMIKLVEPRELGLYVVAVTLASVSSMVTSPIGSVLLPRVSAGEEGLAARAVRTGLLAAGLLGVLVAVAVPGLIYVLFGADFADAIPLALVLLAASVPLAGASMLHPALVGAGRPGASSYGELAALAVTIPGLVLLLPILGAMGAALVSLLAYTLNFGTLLAVARGRFRQPLREFLLPTRADLAWLVDLVRTTRLWAGRG